MILLIELSVSLETFSVAAIALIAPMGGVGCWYEVGLTFGMSQCRSVSDEHLEEGEEARGTMRRELRLELKEAVRR